MRDEGIRGYEIRWKVNGPDGAAEVLGVNTATLVSRMNKWGLQRPASR